MIRIIKIRDINGHIHVFCVIGSRYICFVYDNNWNCVGKYEFEPILNYPRVSSVANNELQEHEETIRREAGLPYYSGAYNDPGYFLP